MYEPLECRNNSIAIFCPILAHNLTAIYNAPMRYLLLLYKMLKGLGSCCFFLVGSLKNAFFNLPCAKTYWQSFWMGHFGHHMPKHSSTWSNSPVIRALYLGKWKKPAKKSSGSGVITYIDKKGKKKCHGTPLLKRSQLPDFVFTHVDNRFSACLRCASFALHKAVPSGICQNTGQSFPYVPLWLPAEAGPRGRA